MREKLSISKSSHITGAYFNPKENELEVRFGHSKYTYKNVTRDMAQAFSSASSAGAWFYENIKKRPHVHPHKAK